PMGDAVNLKYLGPDDVHIDIRGRDWNEAISFGMQRYDLTPVKEEAAEYPTRRYRSPTARGHTLAGRVMPARGRRSAGARSNPQPAKGSQIRALLLWRAEGHSLALHLIDDGFGAFV